MNKVLPIVIWVAIAALGAAGFGVLALSRGETISAAWLVVAGLYGMQMITGRRGTELFCFSVPQCLGGAFPQ
jgi:hypothetical protein